MKLVQGVCTDSRAIEVSKDLYLVPKEAVVVKEDCLGKTVATEITGKEDLDKIAPLRYDLPKDHPLYGRRILLTVPAGSGDLELTAEGVVSVTSGKEEEDPIKEEDVPAEEELDSKLPG